MRLRKLCPRRQFADRDLLRRSVARIMAHLLADADLSHQWIGVGESIPPVFTDIELIALQLTLTAIGLFVYVHRLISRPYSKFAIYLALDMGASENSRLSFRRRVQLWRFLFWRQVAAGVVTVLLSAPLNSLVSLIGLRTIFGSRCRLGSHCSPARGQLGRH